MIKQDLILDYDLIRGLPGDVANNVQRLIASCEGWQPKGEPIKMKLDDCEIIVQCVVKLKQSHAGLFEESE